MGRRCRNHQENFEILLRNTKSREIDKYNSAIMDTTSGIFENSSRNFFFLPKPAHMKFVSILLYMLFFAKIIKITEIGVNSSPTQERLILNLAKTMHLKFPSILCII